MHGHVLRHSVVEQNRLLTHMSVLCATPGVAEYRLASSHAARKASILFPNYPVDMVASKMPVRAEAKSKGKKSARHLSQSSPRTSSAQFHIQWNSAPS